MRAVNVHYIIYLYCRRNTKVCTFVHKILTFTGLPHNYTTSERNRGIVVYHRTPRGTSFRTKKIEVSNSIGFIHI